MSATSLTGTPRGFSLAQYVTCLNGIVWREALRFQHQRERFVSALVRPLVWLLIFAAGFRQVLGISIIPPYETYILYEVYIAPGLMAPCERWSRPISRYSGPSEAASHAQTRPCREVPCSAITTWGPSPHCS